MAADALVWVIVVAPQSPQMTTAVMTASHDKIFFIVITPPIQLIIMTAPVLHFFDDAQDTFALSC